GSVMYGSERRPGLHSSLRCCVPRLVPGSGQPLGDPHNETPGEGVHPAPYSLYRMIDHQAIGRGVSCNLRVPTGISCRTDLHDTFPRAYQFGEASMAPVFPTTRLRRLRRSEALRGLVRETAVTADDLIQPLFIEEGIDEPLAIAEMPGVSRIPERKVEHVVEGLARDGGRALMLFGISHHKDASGSDAWNRDGLVARMVRRAKRAAPELVVIPDICFCEYTDHGHCGVIEHDHVANDITIENLARQAVVAADAGADLVAPSAMMDGQVAAIRQAL